MKLHLFSSGTIRAWKHLLVRGAPQGIRFTVPVPFYLLEHSSGWFLFDTGQRPPEIPQSEDVDYISLLTEEDLAVNQLRRRGITPADISGIILSHFHWDHIAGLADFSGVTCYIRREDAQFAPIKNMVETAPGKWVFPEGNFDLCGDGEIILIPTPGHTAGHQSVLLTLDNGERVLLTADAAYTQAALVQQPEKDEIAQPYWQSIALIKDYAADGVRIITGHDPDNWQQLQTLFL